jgi:hypothetical protein
LHERVIGHKNAGPDGLDQLFLGNEAAGVLGEIAQDVKGFGPRANFVLLESGGIPDALSMSESLGIDSFLGASDAEALFHRLAWPSD